MDNFCGVNALKGLRYLLQYVDPVYRHDMLRHKYQISFYRMTKRMTLNLKLPTCSLIYSFFVVTYSQLFLILSFGKYILSKHFQPFYEVF